MAKAMAGVGKPEINFGGAEVGDERSDGEQEEIGVGA